MGDNSPSLQQDLCGFAVELRQLAYSMPGGHEDPLIRLSERMMSRGQRLPVEETHRAG